MKLEPSYIHPRPWHAEASRLLAEGHTQDEVADLLGVGRSSVYFFAMTPERRAKHRERVNRNKKCCERRVYEEENPIDAMHPHDPSFAKIFRSIEERAQSLIGMGFTDEAASQALGCSPGTIRTYRNEMKKRGVSA